MNRTLILFAAALFALTGCSQATRLTLCYEGLQNDTLFLSAAPVGKPIGAITDTVVLRNGAARHTFTADEPLVVWVMPRDFVFDYPIEGGVRTMRNGAGFMALVLTVGEQAELQATSHGAYATGEVNGSILNREVVALYNARNPLQGEFFTAIQSGDFGTAMALQPQIAQMMTDYIDAHPDRESAVFALSQLDEEQAATYYEKIDKQAFAGIFQPLQEQLGLIAEGRKVLLGAKQAIVEGGEAPDFTLPTANGEEFRLSSLRGRWVVLDFWGSWCGWCVAGFPKMKACYAKYHPQVEFVGIACKDTEAKWHAAIKQHELPWMQLFNSRDLRPAQSPMHCYGVEGFPTKIILTPEGKIHRIFVGESGDFYQVIDNLFK